MYVGMSLGGPDETEELNHGKGDMSMSIEF